MILSAASTFPLETSTSKVYDGDVDPGRPLKKELDVPVRSRAKSVATERS